MDNTVDEDLLRRFVRNQCTDEEVAQIRKLMLTARYKQALSSILDEEWNRFHYDEEPTEAERSDWFNTYKARKNTLQRIDRFTFIRQTGLRWLAYGAAACILVFVATYMYRTGPAAYETFASEEPQEILPGSEKAVLTLSDGSTISLSDVQKGSIVDEGGVQVQKTADGEIVYSADVVALRGNAYNRIATPKGGQYRITLPDGSKAWLNAASSMTYPIHFNENERRVTVTGEVYFEIARLSSKVAEGDVPFVVETARQEIHVLGTQFNVNAYTDEPFTTTTLVEGRVKVMATGSGQSVLLHPGEFALLDDRFRVQSANVRQAIAWKNGEFVFEEDNLGHILKQLSRWYDVEINCPQHLLEQRRFSGIISRSLPLSTIIKMIQSTREINIEIKERRLVVSE